MPPWSALVTTCPPAKQHKQHKQCGCVCDRPGELLGSRVLSQGRQAGRQAGGRGGGAGGQAGRQSRAGRAKVGQRGAHLLHLRSRGSCSLRCHWPRRLPQTGSQHRAVRVALQPDRQAGRQRGRPRSAELFLPHGLQIRLGNPGHKPLQCDGVIALTKAGSAGGGSLEDGKQRQGCDGSAALGHREELRLAVR